MISLIGFQAIGDPILEEDQVGSLMTLLGSLPRSYSTLLIALEARVKIRLIFVQEALILKEQKIKGQFGHLKDMLPGSQMASVLIGTQKKVKPGNSTKVIFAETVPNESNNNVQD